MARLTQLSGLHPRSAAIQLNLGIAQYWAGEAGETEAWKSAAESRAGHGLRRHGREPPPSGLRTQPARSSSPSPSRRRAVRRLDPPAQFATLERRARNGSVADRLFYGVALQRLGKQQLRRARFRRPPPRLDRTIPRRGSRQAVGLFDKAQPALSFSRLGPLSRTFPKAATVRFHLGLLLLWSGELKEAKRQLRLAQAVEPGSRLVCGREAVPRHDPHGRRLIGGFF